MTTRQLEKQRLHVRSQIALIKQSHKRTIGPLQEELYRITRKLSSIRFEERKKKKKSK